MKWDTKTRRERLSDAEKKAIWAELLKRVRALNPGQKYTLRPGPYTDSKRLTLPTGYELLVRLAQEMSHYGMSVMYRRPYLKFGDYVTHHVNPRVICGKDGFDWADVAQTVFDEGRFQKAHRDARERAESNRAAGQKALIALFKRWRNLENVGDVYPVTDGTFEVTLRLKSIDDVRSVLTVARGKQLLSEEQEAETGE